MYGLKIWGISTPPKRILKIGTLKDRWRRWSRLKLSGCLGVRNPHLCGWLDLLATGKPSWFVISVFFSYSLSQHYQDKSLTIILTIRWTFLCSHFHFKTTTHLFLYIFIYILKLIISSFTRWTGLLQQYQDLEDVLVLLSPTLWQIRRSIHIQKLLNPESWNSDINSEIILSEIREAVIYVLAEFVR